MLKDSTMIEAWFAPKIPVSVGPGQFVGLPGAILKLTIQGQGAPLTIEAKEINFDNADEHIIRPTKGKSVSPEEFEEIVEKRMKEMEDMMGKDENSVRSDGKGNVEIKIIRN
jgi:GLPGLI family protein